MVLSLEERRAGEAGEVGEAVVGEQQDIHRRAGGQDVVVLKTALKEGPVEGPVGGVRQPGVPVVAIAWIASHQQRTQHQQLQLQRQQRQLHQPLRLYSS